MIEQEVSKMKEQLRQSQNKIVEPELTEHQKKLQAYKTL